MMDLDPEQLRALAAAVTHGSLDAAARSLHVTPSAISQRLRGLESATGQVLLVRSRPVRPTPAGEVLVRLARQIDLLVGDTRRALRTQNPPGAGEEAGDGAGDTLPVLSVAVNADSLATWVVPAFATVAGLAQLRIHREDETRTGSLLRDGTVVAAVTTEARPVAGCRVTPLGAMRYRPMAAPHFVAGWLPGGVTRAALGAAPVVTFDDTDDTQHAYLRRHGQGLAPPVHSVPSSAGFITAIRLGMGWGMVPDLEARALEATGALVELEPDAATDVLLHWQRWALNTPSLDALTAAIVTAARQHLVQPPPQAAGTGLIAGNVSWPEPPR